MDFSTLLKSPWAEILSTQGPYDGTHTGDEANAIAQPAAVPRDMLTDYAVDVLMAPGGAVFNLLAANDGFVGWAPASPLVMIHCPADDVVPYNNAVATRNVFLAMGLPPALVQIVDVQPVPFVESFMGSIHAAAPGSDHGSLFILAAGIDVDYTLFFAGRVPEAIRIEGGRGMRKRISAFFSMVLFISIACGAFAEDDVDRDKKKAQDLILKAIEHINKAGNEQAFKDFTAKDGGFVDGSFYIFVVDFKGMTLAHGGNPALVGQSMYELKDADGKLFIQEFIKVAKDKGSAWVDYKWSNPTTKKVEPKSTFVKRMEGADFFLGCGIYLKK